MEVRHLQAARDSAIHHTHPSSARAQGREATAPPSHLHTTQRISMDANARMSCGENTQCKKIQVSTRRHGNQTRGKQTAFFLRDVWRRGRASGRTHTVTAPAPPRVVPPGH